MNGMRLAEAARMVGGELRGADAVFTAVSTDTRTLTPGALFVALRGPNFDGHDFVEQARAAGAVAAMVSRAVPTALPLLLVEDTRLALGRLAAAHRAARDLPLVAVTGSNGKTTVKEMVAAILAQRAPVLATQGNLNNDIGMPLTLLRLAPEHGFAVIEMGASHPGEVAYLTRIAQPTVALVTNAGPAHLEGFGSIEGVARAKAEIYAGLAADGVAVINADDAYAALWDELNRSRRRVHFGLCAEAEVRADPASIRFELQDERLCTAFRLIALTGETDVRLSLAGRHNVRNALAAAAATIALGMDLKEIRAGLEGMQPVQGRLQLRAGLNGVRVIDDTYNANPASFQAGIEVLAACPGTRCLVLGDMAELGEDSPQLHRRVGEQARSAGIERLYAVGEQSRAAVEAFGAGARHCAGQSELIAALRDELGPGAVVLVKGSRRMRMERVVEALMGAQAPENH
ncbi:MAG: UDP-N-acetylmuramoyl-tripeptide--D-alanyl-D-alanine ligase [Gammaproteobacteria bacterium]